MTEENTTSPSTIGSYLKESREGKKVSLKIVSQHTRISLSMLENLELDQLDQLPSKAYVRGFVKSYAKTLGLNESECIKLLESTYHLRFPHEPETKEVPKEPEASIKISSGVKVGIGVVAALIVVVALIFESRRSGHSDEVSEVKTQTEDSVVAPETLTEDTPLQDPTPEQVATTVTAVATASATEAPKVVATAAPTPKVEVKAEVKKEEPKVEQKKEEAQEEITFRPFGATPLYSYDTSATEAQLSEWLPAYLRSSMVPGKQNVFITAINGDSWLTYREDSGDIKKFVLKEGRHIMLRGDLVLLFLGNLSGVKVFLNNQLLSLQSRSGVKSVIFPQEERTRFSLPLFVYPKDGSVWTSEEYQKKYQ